MADSSCAFLSLSVRLKSFESSASRLGCQFQCTSRCCCSCARLYRQIFSHSRPVKANLNDFHILYNQNPKRAPGPPRPTSSNPLPASPLGSHAAPLFLQCSVGRIWQLLLLYVLRIAAGAAWTLTSTPKLSCAPPSRMHAQAGAGPVLVRPMFRYVTSTRSIETYDAWSYGCKTGHQGIHKCKEREP